MFLLVLNASLLLK